MTFEIATDGSEVACFQVSGCVLQGGGCRKSVLDHCYSCAHTCAHACIYRGSQKVCGKCNHKINLGWASSLLAEWVLSGVPGIDDQLCF